MSFNHHKKVSVMKNSIYKTTFMLLLLIFSAACSKDLIDEKPPHLITSETLFTNLAGFEAGLNGLYAQVRREKEQG